MVSKKSEIRVCGKFKKKKDIIKLMKNYQKRGYKFKKIFREKDRVCIGFEEPKRKRRLKRFWKTKKR